MVRTKRKSRKKLTIIVETQEAKINKMEKQVGSLLISIDELHRFNREQCEIIKKLEERNKELEEKISSVSAKNDEYLDKIKNSPNATTILNEWLNGETDAGGSI